jgi:serine/threonine protein kinase
MASPRQKHAPVVTHAIATLKNARSRWREKKKQDKKISPILAKHISPKKPSPKKTTPIKSSCQCSSNSCVIYPGLKTCVHSRSGKDRVADKDRVAGKISKTSKTKTIASKVFFDLYSYEKEKQVFDQGGKLLLRLDPQEKYFLSHYEDCINPDDKEIERAMCRWPEEKEKDKEGKDKEGKDKEGKDKEGKDKEGKDKIKKINKKAINFSYLGTTLFNKMTGLSDMNAILPLFIALRNSFEGLIVLHKHGIFHCDITPQNLVLDDRDIKKTPMFKIIDFGGAIFPAGKTIIGKTLAAAIEELSHTPGYESPEYHYYKHQGMHRMDYFGDSAATLLPAGKIHTSFSYTLPLYEFNEKTDAFEKRLAVLGQVAKQEKSFDYYASINKAPWFYYKNDIWAMGRVLFFLLRKIIELYEIHSGEHSSTTIASYRKLVSELQRVIANLLILDIEQRPDAAGALLFYNAFLARIQGLRFEAPQADALYGKYAAALQSNSKSSKSSKSSEGGKTRKSSEGGKTRRRRKIKNGKKKTRKYIRL